MWPGETLGCALNTRWPVTHTLSFSVLGSAHHAEQWHQIRESHGSPPGPAGVASLLLVKGTPLLLEAGGVQERTHIVPTPEDAYIPLQSSKVALL